MSNRIQDLIGQLASEAVSVHAAAADQLVRSGAAAAVALSRVCNTPSAFSRRAAAALVGIGRFAIEPLIAVLKTGDRDAQVQAITGLRLLNEPSSLPSLLEALESPYSEVRKAAIGGLWMLRDRKAVGPLIRHLKDDDIEVAAAAAGALGWIEDRQAVAPLLLALENRNWRLRQAAAYALGSIGDDDALDAVRRHLFDPKPQVRKAVKCGLARFHQRNRNFRSQRRVD
jgi:HEAT repeat protein